MIKLQNVNTPICSDIDTIKIIAEILRLEKHKIKTAKLYRRSIDARKKPDIYYCDTYLVTFNDQHTEKAVLKRNKNALPYTEKPYFWRKTAKTPSLPPIVVGSGPAGLFAALTLARAGIPPIIIERGEPVDDRIKSVNSFWEGKALNPNSNVQFGEGGAGTFSDGKLNTGIKDPRCRTVLETFFHFGANEDILIKAKPHIGTDVLRDVVKNIRKEIENLGGEYRFNTRFIKPVFSSNRVASVVLRDERGEYEIPTEHLILALGNAAADTFTALWDCGINIIPKPFAIGMRIEHLQEDINRFNYGNGYSGLLPPAEYKLSTHLKNGRGVYTFCMCPGGAVINSASEPDTYVTNGMSYQSRSEKNANSALLVGVTELDFFHLSNNTPFGGIYLQKQIEKAAFQVTGGAGVPVQTVGSFLKAGDNNIGMVAPTIRPNFVHCDLDEILPQFITDSVREALPIFDRQIKGFASHEAILTAPETRSSCPIRIVRNDRFQSNLCGLFPCGEGAGYAGGITSSAVDGIRTAEALLDLLQG